MSYWRTAAGLLVFGLLSLPAAARADRIPSGKVQIQPNPGARQPIAVPYTTNGSSNLGVYQGVAPRIFSSPIVSDLNDPQAKPVFNIPFYGAIQAFGTKSNGATPRPSAPYIGR